LSWICIWLGFVHVCTRAFLLLRRRGWYCSRTAVRV
jgi:hypothetical protein